MNLSFNTLIQQFIRMIYYRIENFLPDRHAKLIEFMDQIAQSGNKNCRVKIFEFKVVSHPRNSDLSDIRVHINVF